MCDFLSYLRRVGGENFSWRGLSGVDSV
jgi:hypothetical protein